MAAISASELSNLSQQGGVELIDVRTPVEFDEVHVGCARNIPLDRLDPKAIMKERNGMAGKPLYLICKTGTRSGQALRKFAQAGFENVLEVDGGLSAWQAAGLPVVRGKKAFGIDRQMRIVAGSLILTGVILSYWFPYAIGLSAFVGAGLIFAGLTDICPMMNILGKMPWNQRAGCKV